MSLVTYSSQLSMYLLDCYHDSYTCLCIPWYV